MGRFRDVELDDVELTGPRLTLRRWRVEDATRVHTIMQDPSMRQFLALPDPYTPLLAREFVTSSGHEGRGLGLGVGSAVVERDTGRVVGSAALRFAGQPDLGYWIAPDARGHGYATEACRVLTDFGFGLGLHRIQLLCDVSNLASVRTALGAGYRFEGVIRDAGVTTDDPPDPADLACFSRLPGDAGAPVPPAFAPLPPGGLTDGVVTLRVVAAGDADGLAGTDDELAERTGFGQPRPSPRDYTRMAARGGLDHLVGGRVGFAVVDVASGSFAGSMSLRHAGPPGVGGIGYSVHPAFRGRGYTARALRLLVPWAFEVAGLARLELGAKQSNVASQRAALSGGFLPDAPREGRLRTPAGSYEDEARFYLLNPATPRV